MIFQTPSIAVKAIFPPQMSSPLETGRLHITHVNTGSGLMTILGELCEETTKSASHLHFRLLNIVQSALEDEDHGPEGEVMKALSACFLIFGSLVLSV